MKFKTWVKKKKIEKPSEIVDVFEKILKLNKQKRNQETIVFFVPFKKTHEKYL